MIVRCLSCGKVMIADDKHPGFQVCGCKNETMVDWCDEHSIRLYGHMHSRKDMQHSHKDAYNVGVDVNDWYPVTLKELLERR